ncbi:hypothetical protein [Aurantimonas sp. Leaf443]|uniref:hypothetical protein n=1 Tax=Aurantimonas sp. Leaf443 TaxID=1736378 RepID=UPI0006F9B690|nr:hypothetical protein [Aurantimonas sp. Leaf443]KQT85377.1 hypothetical protein ASG48_09065 [Aurantimonas sp. Leaf443]
MRHIEIAEGLRIRFPARGPDFDDGIEVGMLAALMALGGPVVERGVSPAAAEQAAILAGKLGYHVADERRDGALTYITLRKGRARPRLSIVRLAEPMAAQV